MRRRPVPVTAGDAALLAAIGQSGNLVAAARSIGMSRDRAVYRLQRLRAAFGRPLVAARRGGVGHGGSRLTPFGRSVAARRFDTVELLDGRPVFGFRRPKNVLVGRYRAGPPPTVELSNAGPALRVAFPALDGEAVRVTFDPEAVLLAPQRFPSSARNVLEATVAPGGRDEGDGRRYLPLRAGAQRLWAGVTAEAVREMGLRAGRRVYLYLKATALRPLGPGRTDGPSPARLRSRARRRPRPRGGSASR